MSHASPKGKAAAGPASAAEDVAAVNLGAQGKDYHLVGNKLKRQALYQKLKAAKTKAKKQVMRKRKREAELLGEDVSCPEVCPVGRRKCLSFGIWCARG